jgi:hypothetical protein
MKFPFYNRPGSWSFIFFLIEIKYKISLKLTKNLKLSHHIPKLSPFHPGQNKIQRTPMSNQPEVPQFASSAIGIPFGNNEWYILLR